MTVVILAANSCHSEHCHLANNYEHICNEFTDITNSLAAHRAGCYKLVALCYVWLFWKCDFLNPIDDTIKSLSLLCLN